MPVTIIDYTAMNLIDKTIRFSLRNRLIVLVGAVLMVVGGIISSRQMDVDVFPDLTATQVVIMTDAHGMAAEEVERLVTFPIETAINGATDVRRVRSVSRNGVCFVWAEFNWGMDVFKARQVISEKMASVLETLPEGITPVLAPQSSIMGEILFIGLRADSTSMADLRTMAEWIVKPAILATGGVSQVSVIGGEIKEYQILADPQRMAYYGVSLSDLEEVGRTFSNNSTGNVIRDYGNEYALRGIARTSELDELGASFVTMHQGRPVVLSDVADIRIGNAIRTGHASQDAHPAVILSVSKQPDINTLEVTKRIEQSLHDIQKSLPADVILDSRIFRQADFIETSVSNVGRALAEGAVFVIIVLFLFLGSFRTTVISVTAIPLSLLGTLIVLNLLGMDINTMTLGGMCIAIGSLVDDAIIDVENVYKRLRQNHMQPAENRRGVFDVVFHASSEIRSSIINATLIIMVAFTPLFFLSGMEGRLLKPLGITFIISLFMSLLVAMTVTPLLCRDLLSDDRYLTRNEKDGWLAQKLQNAYYKSLEWVLNHRKPAIYGTLALLLISIALVFTMGSSFLPEFQEGSATITVVAQPGISLDMNDQLGNLIENELLSIPEVESTARRSGRGELDEHSQTSNGAEVDVRFTLTDRTKDELFNDMRAHLARIPGIATTIGQPLGHRIDHILSGTQANIAIKLFGTDLSRMYMTGRAIQSAIAHIEGLVDVQVEQQTETPEIQIRANRMALARHGISIGDFNDFIKYGFGGEKLSDIYEGQRSFDVVLRLKDTYTDSMDGVRLALIDTYDGGKVPLEEVAEIVSAGGPNMISRENVQRKLVISANTSGRDVVSVVNDVKEAIENNITLPEGYRIEYGGQFESARSATRTLAVAIIAALIVIFLLICGEFRKLSLAAMVMASLPLALIGGIMAIYFSSGVISIPSIIGFITLFGIATRNSMLLVSKYMKSTQAGIPIRTTVLDGSIDRLNPILMTALTSALALIPLVLNGDKPGNEIQSPMAVVVLGGLITSTLLNLYIMPIAYEWYAKRRTV